MLKSKKNVFWEALFITIVIFIGGLLLGVFLESGRLNDINEFYAKSEISLMDILIFNDLLKQGNVNCSVVADENLAFANRIYEEAKILERYSASEKLSENTQTAHKRYDLMRTLLWVNLIETESFCSDASQPVPVIYLYELETEDLAQKATQNVWSKILADLKEQKGSSIILIPIAADSEISSLESLIDNYEIPKYPVVIINNKYVVSELSSVEELEKYLG